MSSFFVGIGGVARAGKDSFADALLEKINQGLFRAVKMALAKPLKQDCAEFIKEKLGIDVWTNNTEEKAIFREMLVWYGKVKRQQTQGTYWTGLLDKEVEELKPHICIVPDIRYQQYEKDEVWWLKNKGGVLIHLERTDENGNIIPPANADENINDSIVKSFSDVCFSWPTYCTVDADPNRSISGDVDLVYNETILPALNKFIDNIPLF